MEHLIKAYDKCVDDYRFRTRDIISRRISPIINSRVIGLYVAPDNFYPDAVVTDEIVRNYFYGGLSLFDHTPRNIFNLVKYLYNV